MPKRNKKLAKPKPTKLRPMVHCYCKECNGALVETRTRQRREEEEKRLQSVTSKNKGKRKESDLSSMSLKQTSISMSPIIHDDIGSQSDEEFLTPKPVFRQRRKRYDQFQKTSERSFSILDEETNRLSSSDEEDSVDDLLDLDDDQIPIDLFAAPIALMIQIGMILWIRM
jgi:hypothetical protein